MGDGSRRLVSTRDCDRKASACARRFRSWARTVRYAIPSVRVTPPVWRSMLIMLPQSQSVLNTYKAGGEAHFDFQFYQPESKGPIDSVKAQKSSL
jgi:hypothetical protein